MICLLLFLYTWSENNIIYNSQNALTTISLFEKSERIEGKDLKKPHQLAYWPIIPGTDMVWLDSVPKTRDVDYTIDYELGQISIETNVKPESIIRINYHIIPVSVDRTYQRRLFEPLEVPSAETPGKVTEIQTPQEPPPTLSYSGSKTVSLSMESLRGLSINQPTRLNISGKVSEDVSVTAMLSDQNLPLQPEGTTEEIEDLDRILIKIEGKHLSATMGDYEASFGDTEFVLFPKMLEGAQAQGEYDAGGFALLGAVSRGKSSSITFQGIEGQSEYRISVDGKYIVVIAGSETVWLNGEKMRRGEENDYIVNDYGDPTIEFTNKHLITSKDVVVVDFEYIEEDQNYRQDLYGARGKVNFKTRSSGFSSLESGVFGLKPVKATLGASYAVESDDKENPLVPLTSNDLVNLKRNNLDPDGDGVLLPASVEHSVIGFDSSLSLGDNTTVRGEVALSKHDFNTFSVYDKPKEGKAWKLIGSSGADRFRVNMDLRQLDPDFVPVGATFSSRSRSTYQEDYEDTSFGGIQPIIGKKSPGEKSYDVDLWCEPIEHVELRGDLGKSSSDYGDYTDPVNDVTTISKQEVSHWSRSMKIALPDLPEISTRYQEAITEVDGEEELRKNRELWELKHHFWKKVNIGARSEDIESIEHIIDTQSLTPANSRNRRKEERRLTLEVPTFKKVSLSGEYSFETEYMSGYSMLDAGYSSEEKVSSAHTISADLTARHRPWLDFSGHFARRKFSRLSVVETEGLIPASSTTNLVDLNLNLKALRINYQVDRKLSSEREEVYVNYVVAKVDGREERRYLKPGEGSYIKIDEYTYREDMEKGEYIRLVRTVGDRPVASLALQGVLSLQPRTSFRRLSSTEQTRVSVFHRLIGSVPVFEMGLRIGEDQENASRGFYLLQDLQTDKTTYGTRRYWSRAQLSPVKWLSLAANWEMGKTLNKRINNNERELRSDRWNITLENSLAKSFSLGGELEQDNSSEAVSGLLESDSGGSISDISERRRSRSLFINYRPAKTLSRLRLEGKYESERDEDALSGEMPVFTKIISLGSEAVWGFRGKGTATAKYEIARGSSSGKLPFTRYDFHEGISHNIRLETNYRLKWFTDVIARIIYRAELAEDKKPDHRLEVEMTANF